MLPPSNDKRQAIFLFLSSIFIFSILFLYAVRTTDKAPYLENGWEYSWSDRDGVAPTDNTAWHPMDFPGQPPGRNDHDVLWLRIKLPDEKIAYPTIFTKYIRQSLETYLDNTVIYTYDDPAILSKRNFTPYFPWHLIVLPPDAPGKTLYFRIHSTGPSIGIMATVQYAPLLEVLSDKAILDLFKIISATITLFLGLFILLLYVRDRSNPLYLAFSGTALVGAIIVFGGTFTCMLIWNNAVFWTRLGAAAGLYWPVFLLNFLSYVADEQYKKHLQRLVRFVFVFSSISMAVFLFDPTLIKVIYLPVLLIHLVNYLVVLYVFRTKLRFSQEAQVYALGSTIWFITFIHDALSVMNLVNTRTPIGALGQLAEILALTTILILRYLDVQNQLKTYSLELEQKNADLFNVHTKLNTLNQNLEHTVTMRTRELTVQKSCLQQLFEKSPDAMAMLNTDYQIINVNPAFELLFGINKQAAIGEKIDVLIPIPSGDEESEYIRNSLASGHTIQLDTMRKQANGEMMHASLIAYPYITDIDTNGIYVIYRDISERKRAEKLLKDSEKQYRLIAENTSDVIWLMDINMNLLYISPSIEKLLGFTPDEIMCQPLSERNLPLSPMTIKQLIEAYALNDKTAQLPILIELEQLSKDTKNIWTESLISIAKSDNGDMIGFLGVTRNINERKLTQNLLLHSYERKKSNEFFNIILRNSSTPESEMYLQGLRNQIQIPQQFSLYIFSIGKLNTVLSPNTTETAQMQMLIDTVVDSLNSQPSTIAWEFSDGVGIIRPFASLAERKTEEYEIAKHYLNQLSALFPYASFKIGIADYSPGLSNFALRFKHAQTAVKAGSLVWPNQSVYHFEDCGVYQVLAHYADTNEAAAYVDRTLGPLLDYDQNNGTDLLLTLENILLAPNLKEVADQMFFHHKTILSRKQRIEKILDISLDSFEARMALGAAIHILKLLRTTVK